MLKWCSRDGVGCGEVWLISVTGTKKRKTMKTGKTLQELAAELTRQQETKKDYLAVSDAIEMKNVADQLTITGLNGTDYGVAGTAHDQFADNLKIPKKYYDRMLAEDKDLLSHNVNAWLKRDQNKRLVRTLDGNVRAFLSSSYRPLDNLDLAQVALPVLAENKCEVISSELTDKRMYIKALIPSMTREVTGSVQKGDVVKAGVVISNSEIGAGAVRIEPMIYRLVCTNGMISDTAMRKYHVGKNVEFDNVWEYFSDKTRQMDDQAFWMKVKDVLLTAFNADIFGALVEKMSNATQNRITNGNLEKVVERTCKVFNVGSDKKQNSILSHLIAGGDLSQYGLVNAVTRTANDEESYESATDLERIGGKVLELNRNDWSEIACAA
jgi:hypothetical protein